MLNPQWKAELDRLVEESPLAGLPFQELPVGMSFPAIKLLAKSEPEVQVDWARGPGQIQEQMEVQHLAEESESGWDGHLVEALETLVAEPLVAAELMCLEFELDLGLQVAVQEIGCWH